MKKLFILAAMVVGMVMLWGGTVYAQRVGMMGYNYGPYGQNEWNYCPYCGNYLGPEGGYMRHGYGMMGRGYGMGPGMMGRGYGPGYGMGPGMMGRGHGMGPGMMGRGYGPGYGRQYGPQSQAPSEPVDKEEAQKEVENYLKSTRNPNLKVGAVEDKGDEFEVTVETKDGALVDKLMVDKETGWMRPAY